MTNWATISPLNDKPYEPEQIEFRLSEEERAYAKGCMAIAKARIRKKNREEESRLLAKALEELNDEA